jgi:nucleotide-binding universal stress UspA family protein
MNTVIVPVDFSESSLNAARYASRLVTGQYGVNMILYHSCQKASEAGIAEKQLEELKEELTKAHPVKMEVMVQPEDDFVEGLERAARHRRADLVVMGMTGKSSLAQVLFGSNTLKVVETKVCPVLIVPVDAQYSPIKNVMLTSDFRDTLHTTPSVPIKNFLDVFNPKLHVVNVNKDHYISLTEEFEKEKQDLKKLFEGYHPEFYFMRLYDVDEALGLFAEDRNIDLVIAIKKDHNFIQKIFSAGMTKKLTYQSRIPILMIHE